MYKTNSIHSKSHKRSQKWKRRDIRWLHNPIGLYPIFGLVPSLIIKNEGGVNGGVSWGFVLSLSDASWTKTHSRTIQRQKEDKRKSERRGEYEAAWFLSRRLWRTQGADQRAPGLFLAPRDCLAFDARSECSSREPGCCSRRALCGSAWAFIRGPSLSLSSPSPHTLLC